MAQKIKVTMRLAGYLSVSDCMLNISNHIV